MSPLMTIISLLSWLLSLYSFCCLIRVVLAWFPGVQRTKFAYYLNRICDPYLDLFRKIRLTIGNLDLSPVIALAVLALLSNLLYSIVLNGTLSLGFIAADILKLVWSVASSIITFLNIIITIRLVVHLLKKDFSSGLWSQLDRIIYPVMRPVLSLIKGRTFSFGAQLGITLAACIIVQTLGSWIIGLAATLLVKLPF